MLMILGIVANIYAQEKPNVILILTDDLNDYPGAFGGHPQAKTPNIDRLAAAGVQFTNAQSNIPVCQPSRNSLFTGVYPFHSNDFGWTDHTKQPVIKKSKTIMQMFQENGYQTLGTGKLLHNNKNDYSVWDEWGNNEKYNYGPFPRKGTELVAHAEVPAPYSNIGSVDGSYGRLSTGAKGLDGWVNNWDLTEFRYVSEDDRDLLPDEKHALWISEKLAGLDSISESKPFFMGVGFVNPHTPLIAPDKFFDMFPLESLIIDNYLLDDTLDTYYKSNFSEKKKGLRYYRELLKSYNGDRELAIKSFLQAYLACVAFVDEQVGVVLDALENSKFKDNTIVIFTSDHGWQMGEKNYLFKNSAWEESTHIPYIIKTPGNGNVAGKKVDHPVSLIDIFPTLIDLCSLEGDNKINETGGKIGGYSLRAFLENTETTQWDGPNGAVSIIGNVGVSSGLNEQHYSYRTKDWRYILYANGNEELYNHNKLSPDNDSYEWYNLAYNPDMESLKDSLRIEIKEVIGSEKQVLPTPVRPDKINQQLRKARTYYIDASNGNDTNSGLSEKLPWSTLEKINNTDFLPGDSILFKAGETWNGQLLINNKGTADNPIVFTRFGVGDKPKINGNGGEIYTIKLADASYTEFSEFEITNTGASILAGRIGIYITAINGDIPGVVVKNVDVHDVNGEVDKNLQSKETGAGWGIYWSNKGSSNGRLVDALIQGCHIYKCERNGIGGAINRNIRHLRLVVKQNLIEQIPGDAIIMNTCENSIAEYNIARDFPRTLPESNAAVGIWPFNSNNTIIQFNEVSGHSAYLDGQGFDSDFWCTGTTIQYNYSHDNAGGFLLICGSKDRSSDGESSPNTGTIVRYNISINDGGRTWGKHANDFPVIYFHGNPEGSMIYNNTFYIGDKQEELAGIEPHFIKEIWGEPWSTSIYNNIFASLFPGGKIDMRKNKDTHIDNNLYYNVPTIEDKNGPITDANKVSADPKFLDMQGHEPVDYQLATGSPAIGTGRFIPDNGGRDFFGNPVSATDSPNIGADNGKKVTGIFRNELMEQELFMVYPNITDTSIYLNITESLQNAKVKISSLTGHVVEEKSYNYLYEGYTNFDVSNYRGGMYIVTLEAGNRKQSKRFIKL